MNCTKCGAELNDGALFCSVCGEKIDSVKVDNSEVTIPAKSGKNIGIILIVGVLVLAVVLALSMLAKPKVSFLDAVEKADEVVSSLHRHDEHGFSYATDYDYNEKVYSVLLSHSLRSLRLLYPDPGYDDADCILLGKILIGNLDKGEFFTDVSKKIQKEFKNCKDEVTVVVGVADCQGNIVHIYRNGEKVNIDK